MIIFIFLLSIFIFIKTLIYGILEIKNFHNIPAGIFIIVLSIICLIGPNVIMRII